MDTQQTSNQPTDRHPTRTARALSIRQPWAELILAGHKTIENRTWPTSWRGRLVIHAALRADPAAEVAAHHRIKTRPRGAYPCAHRFGGAR